MAIIGDGLSLLLLAIVGLPLLLLVVRSGELELLGVAVLSHQWCYLVGFPSQLESDGNESLLMIREERLLGCRL
jgi:hypothetical protein